MQIKEIEEFKEYLKYQLNYSDKTATSYEEDISSFYLFIFAEGVDVDDVDLPIIRNYLSTQLQNGISKRIKVRRITRMAAR